MIRKLRNYFFSGLLIVVPFGITIWIVVGIFNLFDGWFRRLAINSNLYENIKPYYYIPQYGVGFVLTLSLIIFVGFLTQLYLGRKIINLFEQIFLRIPGISNLYHGLKQVTETLMGRHRQIFEQVVLLEYPRKGLYSLGFLTARDQNLIGAVVKRNLVYVFIVTTPNPTSGFFLIVPSEDVIPLDLSIEDAMKMVISSGMVAPKKIHKVPLEDIAPPQPISNEVGAPS